MGLEEPARELIHVARLRYNLSEPTWKRLLVAGITSETNWKGQNRVKGAILESPKQCWYDFACVILV